MIFRDINQPKTEIYINKEEDCREPEKCPNKAFQILFLHSFFEEMIKIHL
jgi:hypothetical protein